MQNLENLCMGCMNDTGKEQVCSICGFDKNTYNEPNALALRTVLAGRYVVGKVINTTGESINYLGFDTVTESVVKISEYFPFGICTREKDGKIAINKESSFVFNEGIIQFIELNKKLGTLSNISALYRIIDIFEVNKTAYTVSEYQPGISLKEFLIRNGGVLNWEQASPLFLPLITALYQLHQNGIIHGGISPETLFVGRDGKVRIADFCISSIRTVGGEMAAQLYPGFAAIEQYRGEKPSFETDVYGFAATMFRTLTGNPPPDSKSRLERDNMSFPRSIAEQVPRGVLVAMANALQIERDNRTSNMKALKEDLQSYDNSEAETTTKTEKKKTPKDKATNRKYILFAALATAVIFAIVALIVYFGVFSEDEEATPSDLSGSIVSTESYYSIEASSTPEKQEEVPDFSGKTLPQLEDQYGDWFEFEVAKKEYNNRIDKGKVCAQSLQIGTSVVKGTKVQLTISLGDSTVTIPKNIKGMSKTEALIALMRLGLDYDNIEFVGKMGDTPTEKETVIGASPELGTKITPDHRVTVYYNTNLISKNDNQVEE